MLTANSNDILFDDLALINLPRPSCQPVMIPVMYGDCDNRFEIEKADSANLNSDCTNNVRSLNSYGDCSN